MDTSSLIDGLNSPDVQQRRSAAEQLCRRGPEARPAAVPLARCAASTDEVLREFSVAALEGLGAPAEGDVESLSKLLESDQADTAYWAATLLGRLEAAAAPAAEALGRTLSHPAAPVRQRAAWALGKAGPAAGAAEKALAEAAESEDRRLARLAGRALDQLRGHGSKN